MLSKNIYKISWIIFTEKIEDLIKISSRFEKKPVVTKITVGYINVNCFFSSQFYNNCWKQVKFKLRDWWIIYQHHIGLPPATNSYPKLSVFDNPLIKTELK